MIMEDWYIYLLAHGLSNSVGMLRACCGCTEPKRERAVAGRRPRQGYGNGCTLERLVRAALQPAGARAGRLMFRMRPLQYGTQGQNHVLLTRL